MPTLDQWVSHGAANPWLLIPTAVLLGALHGLEPGHSKTMMAAFIVAIRGTIAKAVLLGISAAVSHSLVIWLLAATALHFGPQWNAESTEPYFQMASGVLIVALAVWMFLRARHEASAASDHSHNHRDHSHEHALGFGEHGHHRDDYPGPSDGGYQDAHEQAHASDIVRRFGNRNVTTGQIVMFGLTGGLLPCPAALTVLLVCLQLKQLTLGFTLVLSFSFGLALTMVAAGALAAWGVQHASKRIKGFGELARKAPYVSSALLMLLGIYMGTQGWLHLR